MQSMINNKTPGNVESTKEFYETFWEELKTLLMESINRAFYTKILGNSVSLRIQSECGKMRTRITRNTDTFHEVKL